MSYFSRWCPQKKSWSPEAVVRRLEERLSDERHGELAYRLAQVIFREHFVKDREFSLCRRGLRKTADFQGTREWAMRQAIGLVESAGVVERVPTFLVWQTVWDDMDQRELRTKRPIRYKISGEFMKLLIQAQSWQRRAQPRRPT